MILPTGGLHGVQEAGKLLMPMALHAASDHLAVEHIEGGEQGGGAVPLVVVGHRSAAASFQRRPAGCGRAPESAISRRR
jgi:hypothetical protein